jgi:hypothetical protein
MCIFVRGAIGELLAFIFIPITLLGLYELIYRDYKKWYLFTFGFVFILLSHLISTVLMAAFSIIIILINYKKFLKEKERIKYLLISGIVGLLLGSFFIFPIIEQYLEKSIRIFVTGSVVTNLARSAVGVFKFIQPIPYSQKTVFLYNVGYTGYLLLLIPILVRIKKSNNEDIKSFSKILYIMSIILMIMTTKLFPWQFFENYLSFIQFPWRLLLFVSSFMSLSLGIFLDNISDNKNSHKNINIKFVLPFIIFVSIVCVMAYSAVYSFITPRFNKFDEIIGLGEYLPAEVEIGDAILSNPYYETNNDELVYSVNRKGKNINIEYSNNNGTDTYLEIPVFNYKGYACEGAKITTGNKHRIKLLLNNEKGTIHVYYGMTKIQKDSYVVSGVSSILFIGYLFINKKNKNAIK